MKRSDMIKIMGKWIATEYDFDIIKANAIARELLHFQEEAGMHPSGILIIPQGSENTTCVQTNIDYLNTCKWEKEDE